VIARAAAVRRGGWEQGRRARSGDEEDGRRFGFLLETLGFPCRTRDRAPGRSIEAIDDFDFLPPGPAFSIPEITAGNGNPGKSKSIHREFEILTTKNAAIVDSFLRT